MSGEPGADVVEKTADYIGPAFDECRAACRAAVRATPSLHYVAHHSHKRWDFSIDPFGHGEQVPDAFDRSQLSTLGVLVSSAVDTIDGTLQDAGTGELIRTVLHARHFVVCCNAIVPGEFIMGATFPTGDVKEADRSLSSLATRLRKLQSRRPQNPGGYDSQPPVPRAHEVRRPAVTLFTEVDEDVVNLCVDAVRPDDLHVVGYCEAGELVAIMDQFGHPAMARFFTTLEVDRLREFYRDYAPELAVQAAKLSQLVGELGGPLISLVLDVEQGAIYYRRLPGGRYLMGVTINQDRVRDANERIEKLALDLGAAPLRITERPAANPRYPQLPVTDAAS